ncbi:hypothetical protein FGM00_07090 [Aggregatimonas sangjinii]|uniref:Uncharacterized protein n=1 Tax=Aggregatimonas sangjinii TaxID=2583587 RepID=A0A5B7SMJ9_9FLAO|nr:hypothetical protein [Aggregatimonas sangjinii]QCW99874.1 hypothetical protein FGM00_07090 [Aggregatimonas sangjinii]
METELQIKPYALQHKNYRHTAKSIVATKDMMMKNSSDTVLQKTYVQPNISGNGLIFDVKTISEKYGKGSATEKLNREMNTLLHEITVGTDAKGNFEKIYNKPKVVDAWAKVRKQWKKEANKETREQINKTIAIVEENLANGSFEKEVANQGALYFLFPGLYGNYASNSETVVKRQLAKFLVTQPLPLKIEYKLKSPGNVKDPLVIEGIGTVDEEKLDARELTKFIRTIKDKINMKVELQVDYKERLEFDRMHWLVKGSQQVKVKIPGFYMTESKQEITELEEETHGE